MHYLWLAVQRSEAERNGVVGHDRRAPITRFFATAIDQDSGGLSHGPAGWRPRALDIVEDTARLMSAMERTAAVRVTMGAQ